MRTKALLLVCVVIFGASSLLPGRADPVADVVDNPTAALGSSNVHLLASYPDQGATGGRFAGKYFFMTVSGPALLAPGPSGGLRIYDVSNPELPVLVGATLLPHYENEDVDVSLKRGVALISNDNTRAANASIGGVLFIIDVRDVTKPLVRSFIQYPDKVGEVKDTSQTAPLNPTGKKPLGGPGHIANCILDCNYAWITGARNGTIFVYDLRDLDDPKLMGSFTTPAGKPNPTFTTGSVHDVNVDPYGNVWATGSGGTAMYAPITNPMKPKLLAYVAPGDNLRYDQFIHHNSLRFDKRHVLITEEDWEQPMCGRQGQGPVGDVAGTEGEQGSFQVWQIDKSRLSPLGTWKTELGRYTDGGAAVTIVCSSHWFSFNRNKIVAVGWYNQGVRFLDISNPRVIRQVGYWMGPHTTASAGLFVPGREDLVYSVDYTRGLDVLKIDGGGAHARTQAAPVRAEWFTSYTGVRFESGWGRDPVWGAACLRPAA